MRPADEAIARLAARQKELVARDALLEAQLTSDAIAHRLTTGRLRRLHPAVYTTAQGPLTFEQRALAAVLACGPGAGLADGWAAGLWRMLTEPPDPPAVVRSGARRNGPAGVRLGHTTQPELTTHRGITVTTPLRTLLDLAAVGPAGRTELALNEALALRLVTHAQLSVLAATSRRGAAVLRTLLEPAPGYTREGAERALRTLLLKAQLPLPRFNADLAGAERDAYWPGYGRLVVEVDGFAAHRSPVAFERDRAKDQALTAAGYRPMRITWRQLTEQPESLIARLAVALARG